MMRKVRMNVPHVKDDSLTRAGLAVAKGILPALFVSSAAQAMMQGMPVHSFAWHSLPVRSAFAQAPEPEISIVCESLEEGRIDGRTLFLQRTPLLNMAIQGNAIDRSATEIQGTSLAQLLDPEAEKDTAWREESTEDGFVTYTGNLILGEGTYDVTELCHVVSVCDEGEQSAVDVYPSLMVQGVEIKTIVVDEHAPMVAAHVSTSPSSVIDREGMVTAYFNGDVDLVFSFEDMTRVVSAYIKDADEHVTPLRISRGGTRAQVHLSDASFNSNATLCVEDAAGNYTEWSLLKEGVHTTARGSCVVENAPVMSAGGEEPLVADGTLCSIVSDCVAPTVLVRGIDDGAITNESVRFEITVSDTLLGELAMSDPERVIAQVSCNGAVVDTVLAGYDGAHEEDSEHTYMLCIPASDTHDSDGDYVLVVQVCDLAGNLSAERVRHFTIDTTPPELSVAFTGEGSRIDGRTYLVKERTAHVVIREHNVSVEDLNSLDAPLRVRVSAWNGRGESDVAVGQWYVGDTEDALCLDVVFPPNGTYELQVEGSDAVGNLLIGADGTDVSAAGRYSSGEFVIDDEKPLITIAYAKDTPLPRVLNETDYFNEAVTLDVTVVDRNPDQARLHVTDSWGRVVSSEWQSSDPDEDGEITYTTSFTCCEGDAAEPCEPWQFHVGAQDLVGNNSEEATQPFVIDQTAPEVVKARLTASPCFVGTGEHDDRPILFFNTGEKEEPALVFELEDAYALDDVWMSDPKGAYTDRATLERGEKEGTFSVLLKDPVRDDIDNDAAFDEEVKLHVTDVAGNERVWNLGPQGLVRIGQTTSEASNIPLEGDYAHPQALILDTVAPIVSLLGVEPGTYWNTPQEVLLRVEDYNMAYLKAFDPMRQVAIVRKRPGNDTGNLTSFVMTVAELEGEGATFLRTIPFETDGHYEVDAQLTDLAGNKSDAIHLAEFTIDLTPPVVEVQWDNNDVRNGMYYNRFRTATVVITEHNFEPSLVSIETTGTISPWTDEGDTHICTIAFDRDSTASAPHTLAIHGRDKAGNDLQPFEEPPFVIDTEAPTVVISRRASVNDYTRADGPMEPLQNGSAFAQACEPIVVVNDNENLDMSTTQVALTGKRASAHTGYMPYQRLETPSERELEVAWGNIGAQEGLEGSFYNVAADDVYEISARAQDMAGNESEGLSVAFSINRFGSNFYVERIGELQRQEDGSWSNELIVEAPIVEVHEVNVSGAASELGEEGHLVTKEHARVTKEIELVQEDSGEGYTLETSTDSSELNPYEGWTEYTYVIRAENFGKGSSSDYGDGGQGHYRVNVGSFDMASNANTTASYWNSETADREQAASKVEDISFTLDEQGPTIQDLVEPPSFTWGQSFEASFFVRDEFTNGDYVHVLVDGEPVEVRWADTGEPLGSEGLIDREGMLVFTIPAKGAFEQRSFDIQVGDYTGLQKRMDSKHAEGFCLTTLVGEVGVVLVVVGVPLVVLLIRRVR